MAEMTFPGSLASLFNRHHTVGKDLAIDPDTELRSYQEDIDHSAKTPQATAKEEFHQDERDDE